LSHSGVERPIVAERLPLMLHALSPVGDAGGTVGERASAHRPKRGKEHIARLPERRGEYGVRPSGPWSGCIGASWARRCVIPLVERIIAQISTCWSHRAPVTSAKLAEHGLPPGVIHQFLPLDSRASLRLPRPLKPIWRCHRVRPVAEPDRADASVASR